MWSREDEPSDWLGLGQVTQSNIRDFYFVFFPPVLFLSMLQLGSFALIFQLMNFIFYCVPSAVKPVCRVLTFICHIFFFNFRMSTGFFKVDSPKAMYKYVLQKALFVIAKTETKIISIKSEWVNKWCCIPRMGYHILVK